MIIRIIASFGTINGIFYLVQNTRENKIEYEIRNTNNELMYDGDSLQTTWEYFSDLFKKKMIEGK